MSGHSAEQGVRTRIIYRRYFDLQSPSDEVLAEGEQVEFDGEWLHIVTYEGPTSVRRLSRSYPTHTIEAVLHG